MLSIGFRCVLGHFRRFQVCVILRVGMRMVSEIRLCSLRPEYFARDCCVYCFFFFVIHLSHTYHIPIHVTSRLADRYKFGESLSFLV